MAKKNGWNAVGGGARASLTFTSVGQAIWCYVEGVATTTPDWNLQYQEPDGGWRNVDSQQMDMTNPQRNFNTAAGLNYRIYGDTTTASHYTDVTYYWAPRPAGDYGDALVSGVG